MKTRILSYFMQCITATIACAVDECYCNTFSHGSNNIEFSGKLHQVLKSVTIFYFKMRQESKKDASS